MFLSMVKKQVAVVAPLVNDEVSDLRAEVARLKELNEQLIKEKDAIQRHLNNVTGKDWADTDLINVVNNMDEQFGRIGEHLNKAVHPFYVNLPLQSFNVKFEGDLMARIEALMRYKEKVDDVRFKSAVRLLLGGYFKNPAMQSELEDFVHTCNKETIASSIASRLSCKNADKGVEDIVYAYCKAAVMNTNIIVSNAEEVIDATKIKYSYSVDDQVNVTPIITHDVNVPTGSLDHIYKKHYLDKPTSSLLHALSHVDESITGGGLALYHVGTATRFAECSILYIDGTPFKPFRVMQEYAIFPTLPGEYNGRVEALLSIFGGLSPISLVRVYTQMEIPTGLIIGSISHVVSSLLSKSILYSCEVGFSPSGMYIRAVGNTDETSRTNINCCQASFGNAPSMSDWNVKRYAGGPHHHQRRNNQRNNHNQRSNFVPRNINT